MSGTKWIIWTLVAFRKPGQTIFLRRVRIRSRRPGQNFMGITLMPNVPDQAIMGRIKYFVQGNG